MKSETPRPVGVLGGTFDPVHVGHLRIAEHARDKLGLTRMLLLPTAVPPHKPREALTPVDQRLRMLQLAVSDAEGLAICELELRSDRASYTIDTLRALRGGRPPVAPIFVLGMDALLQIGGWRESEALVAEFDLAVIDRPRRALWSLRRRLDPGVALRVVELEDDVPADRWRPGQGGRIFHLPMEPIRVSSSEIRALTAQGGSLEGLVPPAVAGYIRSSGLYRQEEGSR